MRSVVYKNYILPDYIYCRTVGWAHKPTCFCINSNLSRICKQTQSVLLMLLLAECSPSMHSIISLRRKLLIRKQTFTWCLASINFFVCVFILVGMKHPVSPAHIFEDGIMNPSTFLCGFEEKGLRDDRPVCQLSKVKKKIFSFCEVCNIQLNSAAQAQVHYNGKSHLRRVKQLDNGKLPANTAMSSLCVGTCAGTSFFY